LRGNEVRWHASCRLPSACPASGRPKTLAQRQRRDMPQPWPAADCRCNKDYTQPDAPTPFLSPTGGEDQGEGAGPKRGSGPWDGRGPPPPHEPERNERAASLSLPARNEWGESRREGPASQLSSSSPQPSPPSCVGRRGRSRAVRFMGSKREISFRGNLTPAPLPLEYDSTLFKPRLGGASVLASRADAWPWLASTLAPPALVTAGAKGLFQWQCTPALSPDGGEGERPVAGAEGWPALPASGFGALAPAGSGPGKTATDRRDNSSG